MPLTDTAIRNTKPQTKPFRLFDGDGLYLEISPKGGKWWRLKYRYNGKEKRLSLGVYPEIGLKDARERCFDAHKLLNNGIDPSENRKATKNANKNLKDIVDWGITKKTITEDNKPFQVAEPITHYDTTPQNAEDFVLDEHNHLVVKHDLFSNILKA